MTKMVCFIKGTNHSEIIMSLVQVNLRREKNVKERSTSEKKDVSTGSFLKIK